MEWLRGGKIRYGDEYEKMKVKRKEFVNALKYCKENETKIRNDKMSSAFRGKMLRSFGSRSGIDEMERMPPSTK